MNDATEARKVRILIADDDSLMLNLLREMLTDDGYQVTATNDGEQALRMLQENPDEFDLVLSDFQMPYLNGVELAKEMLADEELRQIPVIIVSGNPIEAQDAKRDAGQTFPNIFAIISKHSKDISVRISRALGNKSPAA